MSIAIIAATITTVGPLSIAMPTPEGNSISLFPFLGAQSARGCGEIKGKFEVKVDDQLVEVIEFGGFEPAKILEIAVNAGE